MTKLSQEGNLFCVHRLTHRLNEKSHRPGDVFEFEGSLFLVHYILMYEVKFQSIMVHYVSQRIDSDIVPKAKDSRVDQQQLNPLIYYGMVKYQDAHNSIPYTQVNSIHVFSGEMLRITSIQSLDVQREGVRFGFTGELLIPENGRTVRKKKLEYRNRKTGLKLMKENEGGFDE